jgi:translation machinery-associated protein 16
MPEEGVLSLQDLHHIISDIWLTRFDEDLEKERSARRKGRPISLKVVKLEQLKLQEAELYRTGMGMQPPLKTVSPEN